MPMSVVYTNFGGQIVHETRGGTETFFTSDPLGSIIEGRNSSGTQTFSFTYWPYGEVRTSSGTNPSQFDFVGALGYYRENSARTYVRARFLRKELGRWLNVDPIWPSIAAYAYVDASPTRYADPSGLLKVVGCDPTLEEKLRKLCARIKEITPQQKTAIIRCIMRTSRASNQTCQPFNDDRLTCFKNFCERGIVYCQPLPPTTAGRCPSYQGPNDNLQVPTGGVLFDPKKKGSNFSNLVGGGNGAWGGRLTIIHEIGHACGVDHGQYSGFCQCNDIYACCLFEVLMGRSGDFCVDGIKEFLGRGGKC